jgi:L-ascorbate metabolism protein UlaG (beta-lactamase superfamily)
MTGDQHERAPRFAAVTWYGQAGFRIASGPARVLIDPFLSDHGKRRYPPPAAAGEFADITLVLCTHEHLDHMDMPFLRDFCAVNATAPIVVPAPVAGIAADGGLDPARLVAAAPGQALRVAGVTVHPLPALHGIGGDEPVTYEFATDGGPARFLGYVMDIGEIRFYHSGDCLVYPELPATLAELGPDVLMLPINGRDHMREAEGIVGNMNETEAAWLCAQVGPAYAIPMHYDAMRGNTGDPGHFVTRLREAGGTAAVLVPSRTRPITLALP